MEAKLKTLVGTSTVKMWQNDLDEFEKKYLIYRQERERLQMVEPVKKKTTANKK